MTHNQHCPKNCQFVDPEHCQHSHDCTCSEEPTEGKCTWPVCPKCDSNGMCPQKEPVEGWVKLSEFAQGKEQGIKEVLEYAEEYRNANCPKGFGDYDVAYGEGMASIVYALRKVFTPDEK